MILATAFINILGLALPLTLLQIYDRILPNTAQGTLLLLVIGVGFAILLETVLRLIRSYVGGWMGARFEHLAGCAAIERLLTSEITEFEKDGSGVHLERFNSFSILRDFFSGQAIITLCDLPFAVLFLLLITYLAGWLVLVPLALIALFFVAAFAVGHLLRQSLENRIKADDRRFNFIIEVLGGVHTVKAMAMENQMLRRYERLQESCAESDYSVAFNSATALGIGTVFSQLTIFSVVGLGALQVINGSLTVGGLAACTMLAGRALQPLQRAAGIWTRFQNIRLALDRATRVFDMTPESEGDRIPLPAVKGAIELKNVDYRESENEPLVIDHVSLSIAAGETIAITGEQSSSHSSLLCLVMGVLKPSSGQVLIDGHDLAGLDPDSVRRQIAYLPQDAVLFNGTILENLTMFRPEAEEQALEIAKYLGLDQSVTRMPKGYETIVGDGAEESQPRGRKQRIDVGRALVDRPRILLFNSVNSAMDREGDTILRSFLEKIKGQCTQILVTHRPSLISLADRVFELRNGRLIAREERTGS